MTPIAKFSLGIVLLGAAGVAGYLKLGHTGRAPAVANIEPRPTGTATNPSPLAVAAAASLPAAPTSPDLRGMLREKVAAQSPAGDILALLRAIAVDEPGAAVELALQYARTDEERSGWVSDLVGDWSSRDPVQTWDWLRQHGDRVANSVNQAALQNMWTHMAEKDPQLVVKYADQFLTDGGQPNGFAAQIVAQSAVQALLTQGGSDYACVIVEFWAHGPLASQVGAGTFTDVARSLVQNSLENGVNWLKSIPASADRNVALGEIAAEAMAKSPSETLTWALALPAQEGRSAVAQRAFSEWTERDPAQAGQWLSEKLSKQDAGPEADGMIANLVNTSSLIRANPSAALGWISLMTDATQRATAKDQVLLRWAAIDPAAAGNYLQQDATIDATHRAELLQTMRAQQAAPDKVGPWFATDSVVPSGG